MALELDFVDQIETVRTGKVQGTISSLPVDFQELEAARLGSPG